MLDSTYIYHIYGKWHLFPIRLFYRVNMWTFVGWNIIVSPIVKGQMVPITLRIYL